MSNLLKLLVLDLKYRRLRLHCALLMYGAIVVMGSIPGARDKIGHYAPGLVLHAVAYAGLTGLLFTGTMGSAGQRALKAVLIVAAMGGFDEIVQSFLSYRNGAVSDWLVDCSAALITSSLLWAFLPAPRQA
ncbi:MAG: VanZ family protein [Pseudomonadota bacterium]